MPSLPQQKAVELRLSQLLSAVEQSLSPPSCSGACFSTAKKGSKLKVLRGTKKVAGFFLHPKGICRRLQKCAT